MQLLLGNIGRPGGGILALRGHASIQGSTDIPTLYNILPGYIPMPHAHAHETCAKFVELNAAPTRLLGQHGRLHGQPAQGMVGRRRHGRERLLLRLPAADHRRPLDLRDRAGHARRHGQGLLRGRREPGGRIGQLAAAPPRRWPSSTGWSCATWSRSRPPRSGTTRPRSRRGELRTEEIGTEVFFLPAAAHTEKDGSFTNTQRLLQWHHKAVEPPGDCRSELWFTTTSAASSARSWPARPTERDRPRARAARGTTRREGEIAEPERRRGAARDQRLGPGRRGAVGLHRAEGRRLDRVRLLDLLRRATPTRSTRPPAASPAASRRGLRRSGAGRGRRTGASSTTERRPTPRAGRGRSASATSGGTRTSGKWTGEDVPDFAADKRARLRAARRRQGPGRDRGRRAVHHAGRRPGLAVRARRPRGRPAARPTTSRTSRRSEPALRPASRTRPASASPAREPVQRAPAAGGDVFPFVLTTYRLTEHHTAGGMSRIARRTSPSCSRRCSARSARSWRAERGLEHGGWATIVTARAAIEARVLVTDRIAPLRCRAGRCTRSACRTTGAARGLGDRRLGQRPARAGARPERAHPGGRRPRPATSGPAGGRAGRRCVEPRGMAERAGRDGRRLRRPSYGDEAQPRDGLLHRHVVCIGCKACEVACKEWNHVPEDGLGFTGNSYDNTGALGAEHVAPRRVHRAAQAAARRRQTATRRRHALADVVDVCKHCTHAACLDVCPTGALFRTEFGTVVVQEDICNGCGYCVPACPFGVIDQRRGRRPGVWKCTLCYDRLKGGIDAGVRQGLPDGVDPVRPARRAARARSRAGARRCTTRASPAPGCTARTPTTASAASARSSCCSTSPRCTGCRRIRWSRPATWPRCGGRPARAALGAGRRGARWRRCLGAASMSAAADRAEPRLLLRPADPEGAGLEARDRLVHLHRWPGRRVVVLASAAALTGNRRLARLRAGWRRRRDTRARRCSSRTSAGRSGSATCCGCSSRPRR